MIRTFVSFTFTFLTVISYKKKGFDSPYIYIYKIHIGSSYVTTVVPYNLFRLFVNIYIIVIINDGRLI